MSNESCALESELEERLSSLGVTLPVPSTAQGSYRPVVIAGNTAWVSGQLPVIDGQLTIAGRLGENVSETGGIMAARTCAINLLGVLSVELGGLNCVARFLRVDGYVASAPAFERHSLVLNGASDLLLSIFGDRGRHSRVAVGVASLPLGAPVEIAAVVELRGNMGYLAEGGR